MGISQYVDIVKAKLPSFDALPFSLPPALQQKLNMIDKRQLLLSCGIVFGFYILVFAYVYFTADITITNLEKKMASVSVQLTEKAPSPYGIGTHNTSKSDIDINEMAEANLIEGLSSYDSVFGRLPVIRSEDQLTSFRSYQTPFSLNGVGNKPVISFVLKDYGLSDKTSNMALDILPPEVSFILSPYADLPQEWINRARSIGHEVWMEIPIQQDDSNDTGLNTIFHHNSLIEKGKTMRVSLSRGLGYVGAALFMDKGVIETREHYVKLLEELYGRGLATLEMNPQAPAFMEAMAVSKAAPYIKATEEVKRASGVNPFTTVEGTAQKTRQAIALVPSYPVLIKDLALWIEKVGKVDYIIVPASAIYDLPLARAGALSDKAVAKDIPHSLDKNDLTDPEDPSYVH
jgi:hypothetical protein